MERGVVRAVMKDHTWEKRAGAAGIDHPGLPRRSPTREDEERTGIGED